MTRRPLSRAQAWQRCFALVLCCLVVISSALPVLAAPGGSDDGTVTVTADRVEYNSQTRIVRADGHAKATSRDAVITADHLEANLEAQEIIARGNVTLTQSETPGTGNVSLIRGPKVVKGSFLSYNLRTRVGRFEKATGQFGIWHVSGETIDVAPERDVATQASITSCDPDHPLYKVTAKKIEVVPNDHFTAYDASLWVAGTRIVTLPQYTATFGGRSGPNFGYDTLDGVYLEYANSFALGSWRDEYRIRLGTTTGLSAENLISQRFNDHVWSMDLGRSQVKDQNGNRVNINRYSVDLLYDRERIPGWPLALQFEGHAGSYGELATGVTTTRAEAIATFATDTFVLSPGVYFSASGRVHYDVYGTGQQRTVIEGSTAVSATLTPRTSAALTYSTVAVNGSTPFLFDAYSPSSSSTLIYYYSPGGFIQSVAPSITYDFLAMQTTFGLSLALAINANTAFNVSAYYNSTTRQLTEVDYALNVRCDCATIGIVYRTFPQASGANNQIMLMVGLNAFPGSTFTIGGPGN